METILFSGAHVVEGELIKFASHVCTLTMKAEKYCASQKATI